MNRFCFQVIAAFSMVTVGCGRVETDHTQNSVPPRESNGASLVEARVAATQTGQGGQSEIVQADVRRMLNAVYGADVATVIAYTHPRIIDLMGGSAEAESMLTKTLGQFQTAQMKLELLSFPEQPTFLKTDAHTFAIVPTKIIVNAKGQKMESLNYQFGVKETVATNWTYIEGSRINGQNVGNFFPDFPLNYQFPALSRKKL